MSQPAPRSLGRLTLAVALIGASLAAAPLSPRPAQAASIVVNSLNDSTVTDGACTLREAIANANGDADTTGGDCTAGSGSDTISFNLGGTITLATSLPDVTTTM